MVFCDNQSAVVLAYIPVVHARTKYMEIDLYFVREKVLAKATICSAYSSFESMERCFDQATFPN